MHIEVIQLKPSSDLAAIAAKSAAPNAIALNDANKNYLWAISESRSYVLSGIAASKNEVKRIAEQFGLDERLDYKLASNENLISFAGSKYPIISSIKRQSGLYTIAIWHTTFDYLLGSDPLIYAHEIPEPSLSDYINQYRRESYHLSSDYVKSYIRREEAKRKFATPAQTTSAIEVGFVYANHNEPSYERKTNWQRHRIIKVTDQTIFIDRYAFTGKDYLRSGWQGMILFATMLDRESVEKDHCYYHQTHQMHYYTEKQARRRARKLFIDGGVFTETILELPDDAIAWALKMLDIEHWPATYEAIKSAFARKAMLHHPDRGGTHIMFVNCISARELLFDQL